LTRQPQVEVRLGAVDWKLGIVYLRALSRGGGLAEIAGRCLVCHLDLLGNETENTVSTCNWTLSDHMLEKRGVVCGS
jgi:hypothetical protein